MSVAQPSVFKSLTLWVDYDRRKLGRLTDEERIEYFRRRANLVVLRPLHYLLRGIHPESKRSSSVLCFGTCACCAIEALGRFCLGKVGQGTSHRCFAAFVSEFMSPSFTRMLSGKNYADHLWDHFRNGLAHGLAIKHGGLQLSSRYLRRRRRGGAWQLFIDPERLLADLEKGTAKFVARLTAGPDVVERRRLFNLAFEALWVHGQ